MHFKENLMPLFFERNDMKAIIVNENGSSDTLRYEDTNMPKMEEGSVLIKVAAAPVNFIDTIIREGNMPPGMMPSLPHIPGVEGAGIVVDSNNTSLSKGQKVAYLGPIGASMYAEYAVVQADKLIALPSSVDLLEAASMPVTYFTAYHMLHNVVRAQKDKYALIYASTGGVGTALIQLAKLAGLKVITLDRKEDKVDQAIKLGADYALNSTQPWVDKVNAITEGKGVDYIFNPVAGDTIKDDLSVLAPLGHIVIFGFLAGPGNSNLQAEAIQHFGKAPTITYSEIYATYFNNFSLVKKSLENLYKLLEQGELKPIFRTLPLSDAKTAHDLLEKGNIMGKLILVP